ncbi:MAG: type II toxin-antitoxin system PrlF family antitoxin [Dehalococcoidia bacterium]|nr:type II toxin-antitoxin system PrlF family antitoxin [Dehalococcoidia bacterium]
MKELLATLTQRSQVTVPAEVRRVLGIGPKDKVTFRIEDHQVTLAPAKFTLETAFGSVKPIQRPEDFDKAVREAMEEHADEVVREMQQP